MNVTPATPDGSGAPDPEPSVGPVRLNVTLSRRLGVLVGFDRPTDGFEMNVTDTRRLAHELRRMANAAERIQRQRGGSWRGK